MPEGRTTPPRRDKMGRLIDPRDAHGGASSGSSSTSGASAAERKAMSEEDWEKVERDYRKQFNLPFTIQRKTYWKTSPKSGVPSFQEYYRKHQAKQRGQASAVKKKPTPTPSPSPSPKPDKDDKDE